MAVDRQLLGRGQLPADNAISAIDLHRFFREESSRHIRASTYGAADPAYADTDCAFPGFAPVSADEAAAAVLKLPNKQCSSDPLPTWLLRVRGRPGVVSEPLVQPVAAPIALFQLHSSRRNRCTKWRKERNYAPLSQIPGYATVLMTRRFTAAVTQTTLHHCAVTSASPSRI